MRHSREALDNIRWGTHLPMLTKWLFTLCEHKKIAERPIILEHGTGAFSSPLIHHFCYTIGYERWYIESDNIYAKHFDLGDVLTVVDNVPWNRVALALIDGSRWERQRLIEASGDSILVVHDTEVLATYGYNFNGFTVLDKSVYRNCSTHVIQRSVGSGKP